MVSVLETHNWIAAHPDKLSRYAGYWVAVLSNKIVAYSKTLGKLLKRLRGKKYPGILITHVAKEKRKALLYRQG